FRMALHDFVFFVGQPAGLVENVVGNAHLADVVQQGPHLEAVHVAFRNAEAARDQKSPLRQARAVEARVQIPQIEKLIEAADKAAVKFTDLILQILHLKLRPAKKRVLTPSLAFGGEPGPKFSFGPELYWRRNFATGGHGRYPPLVRAGEV